MRDDFPEDVKRTLTQRVGNRCSNPDCRALTSGPQDDPAKAVNVGVAAHITAASRGGPRYDPALTQEQRRGVGNGIWLCQNCAKLVDNDPARCTAAVLQDWKAGAEEAARSGVGRTVGTPVAVDPTLRLRHDAGCMQCDGPSMRHGGMPTFQIEVWNDSDSRSIRHVHFAVESISPLPVWRATTRFPVNVSRWDALNPGEPPAHAELFWWDLRSNNFVIGAIAFPAASCSLSIVAHAIDTPAARTTFVVEPGPGDERLLWRLRQA